MSANQVTTQHPELNTADAFTVDAVNPNLDQHFQPQDVAAFAFKTYSGPFEDAVRKLSGNEAKRVLIKLVLDPLHKKNIKLVSDDEKSAYYVANDHLIPAKFMMFFHTLGQAVDQAKENKEGESNGTEEK